jgi:uncharacterized protein YijF (DUF1287 family)
MRWLLIVALCLLASPAAAKGPAARDLVAAARAQIGVTLIYDPSYRQIAYRRSEDGSLPLVIHNIGWGAQEEDVLFEYRITGHFRAF